MTGSQGVCNILKNFLTSVFTGEDKINLALPDQICHTDIESLIIRPNVIEFMFPVTRMRKFEAIR